MRDGAALNHTVDELLKRSNSGAVVTESSKSSWSEIASELDSEDAGGAAHTQAVRRLQPLQPALLAVTTSRCACRLAALRLI
jgi:hypothetical protein